jgi:NDP-sugar pyrophosphorylase family protein
MSFKTAIVLAGGPGERLRPVTLEIPKPLIPVRGITLTEHNIHKLKEAGVKKIYLSIGYMADKIIDYFKEKDFDVEIDFLVETEPLGTGGCLKLLSKEQLTQDFSEDFIVINGDNLFDLDWNKMLSLHKKEDAIATLSLTEVEDVRTRGVVELEKNKIISFVEKPNPDEAPTNFVSAGYYIFSPKIFNYLPENKRFMLEKEVFPQLANKKLLAGYYDDSIWFDTGTFERWDRVIKYWRPKYENSNNNRDNRTGW